MITSFCKNGLHSFLGFTNLVDSPLPPLPPSSKGPSAPSAVGRSTTADVVDSTTVYSSPAPTKKDPGGGFGFVDGIGGGVVVDGLMSCTESLGFESSDDLWAEEWFPAQPTKPMEKTKWREESERRREKKFPPPISSLNHKGQRSFFLQPVRTEGRLELTEVRIDRPEILRALREDGRLRLDMIVDEEETEVDDDQETIQEEEEAEDDHEDVQEGQDLNCVDKRFAEEEEEEHGVAKEWKKISIGSEGFGRFHEVVNHHSRSPRHRHHHHHHHNLHDVWLQPCVPTR